MRGVVALLAGGAQLQQEFVELRTELDDAMGIALDHVDVAFPIHRARVLPVGIELLAVDVLIAAGHHQVTGRIEHHDRLGAAVEHVDAILRVNRQARNARLIGGARRVGRGRAGRTSHRAACRGLGFAFRRWRRRVFQPEELAGRQLGPVRHQLVTAITLCEGNRRSEHERDGESRSGQDFWHGFSLEFCVSGVR